MGIVRPLYLTGGKRGFRCDGARRQIDVAFQVTVFDSTSTPAFAHRVSIIRPSLFPSCFTDAAILSKILDVRQKICYHRRVKEEGESGDSRHSPDPPATSVAPRGAHPTLRSILEGPGEVILHQVACHFPPLPIAGLAPLGHVAGKECADEAVLLQ